MLFLLTKIHLADALEQGIHVTLEDRETDGDKLSLFTKSHKFS
jgi:hypothetical protein